MNIVTLIFCLSIATIFNNAQGKYDKIGHFGEYKTDWALVVLNGKKGFINKEGQYIGD